MRLVTLLGMGLILAGCGQRSDQAQPAGKRGTMEERANSEPQEQTNPGAINCARASGQAQQLVCTDAQLSAIAREADRLYRLIQAQPDQNASEPLIDNQRGWATYRDNCWKSDELRQCVVNSYVARIASFRSQLASRNEEAGISSGPVNFLCEDAKRELVATFVRNNPGFLYLNSHGPNRIRSFPISGLTLAGVESATGAKYEGRIDGDAWFFWTNGSEATLTGGGVERRCVEEQAAGKRSP